MASSFAIQDILGLRDAPATPDNAESERRDGPEASVDAVIDSADASPQREALYVERSPTEGPAKKTRKRRRQVDANSVGDESPSSESDGELINGQDSSGGSPLNSSRKSKRLRTAFTVTQLRALEYAFRMCPYPDSYGREQIARSTNIDEAKIQVWFQNRRARYRKREKPVEQPEKRSPTSPHQFPISPYAPSYTTPTAPPTHPSYPFPTSYYPYGPFPYPYYPPTNIASSSFPTAYHMPAECSSEAAPRSRFTGGGGRRSAKPEVEATEEQSD